MELNLVFFVIFSIILASVNGADDYCYSTDANPYLGFGTKSPYDVTSTKDTAVPSGCNVAYVYAIIRHGTRYPTESDQLKQQELTQIRDQIVSNHETDKRGKMCTQDVDLLKNWKYVWDQSNYGKLAPQGRTDMEGLVSRMGSTMSDYSKSTTKDKLTFQTSSKSRCQESAIVFANSLLKTTYQDMDGNNIKVNDDMLKYSDDEDKKTDDLESEKFKKSSAMSNVITQVSERCGYQKSLTIDQILLMYAECKFGKATKPGEKSPFCTSFTSDNLKTMEYMDDLDTNQKLGYGSTKYKEISCPMVRDMYKNLNELENNVNPSQIGSFNFGHSSLVCSLIANLGLRKDDEALKSDNFEKYKDSRKWRTSVMDPFGGNLYIVGYKCSGELKVSIFNNERSLQLPGSDSTLVLYKTVLKPKLEAIIKECPEVKSSAARFSIMREQLALFTSICIVFGFLHKVLII